MKVKLDITKTVDENANAYFETAKKARKKMKGALKTLEEWELKLKAEIDVQKDAPKIEKKQRQKKKKKAWYEKFRWFISSDGFLIIGGRDATTNEIIIKKHTIPKDIVFHTDMAGSPFVVIKSNVEEGKKLTQENFPELTVKEAAEFTASFSRAWRNGMSSLEVFYVNPDQVTKEANPGEYLSKGSFMIRGKTNYVTPEINLAVGIYELKKDDEKSEIEKKIMIGPISAIKEHCKKYVEIMQGNEKTSDTAKKIKKIFEYDDLDEILSALPAGGCKLKKTDEDSFKKKKKKK